MDLELTIISSDEDWIDLREGEKGVLRGQLYGRLRAGSTTVGVTMPDWSIIVADIEDPQNAPDLKDGQRVEVIVTRGETISALARDIRSQQED